MAQFDIADAKARLAELARRAVAGDDIVITCGDEPLVRLVPVEPVRQPRQPGSGKGQLLWMAPDFDGMVDGFEDYG